MSVESTGLCRTLSHDLVVGSIYINRLVIITHIYVVDSVNHFWSSIISQFVICSTLQLHHNLNTYIAFFFFVFIYQKWKYRGPVWSVLCRRCGSECHSTEWKPALSLGAGPAVCRRRANLPGGQPGRHLSDTLKGNRLVLGMHHVYETELIFRQSIQCWVNIQNSVIVYTQHRLYDVSPNVNGSNDNEHSDYLVFCLAVSCFFLTKSITGKWFMSSCINI